MKSGNRIESIFEYLTNFNRSKLASWDDISFLLSEIRRKDEALSHIIRICGEPRDYVIVKTAEKALKDVDA